jgi:hypothetical protein
MFEPYVRISDIGNGYGYSILHNAEDNIYEIAALKGGKYWANTVIHDELGQPIRGRWPLIVEVMVKIADL